MGWRAGHSRIKYRVEAALIKATTALSESNKISRAKVNKVTSLESLFFAFCDDYLTLPLTPLFLC